MIYQLGYLIPSVWTHPYLIYTLHQNPALHSFARLANLSRFGTGSGSLHVRTLPEHAPLFWHFAVFQAGRRVSPSSSGAGQAFLQEARVPSSAEWESETKI